MKVCVIGAGSTYTPELIEGFIEAWNELPISRLVLMDIDQRKLSIVGALAQRMVEASGCDIDVTLTANRQEAVEGAAFVINQIRVGGLQARVLDEKIPLEFGAIGRETTGPGGFAKALRTIPVALSIAREMESNAPNAFLINFTNPAGLITEALLRYSPVPTIGLCNLPIGAEMYIAGRLGIERSRLRLDWVGLNHLNWIRGATVDGQDVWSQVFSGALEEARGHKEEDGEFPEALLESLGMIPCDYLKYYYYRERMLAKLKKASRTRGQEVQEIEDSLLALYQDPELQRKPELLEKRGGAYYSKAAVSLVAAIANDRREITIVNTQHRGAMPDLPELAVAELPCVVGGNGVHPLVSRPLPPQVRGLVQAVKAYEELTVTAAVEGDRRLALQALLAHPLVPSFEAAREMLNALLKAHRAYLPQFFPGG
ncbi:MAG: 6-phospho-beta-glucosidase [Anaerolineae bacterium]|nr:6-phospho-beta-glucosidase [Anaerolineae bacterium]